MSPAAPRGSGRRQRPAAEGREATAVEFLEELYGTDELPGKLVIWTLTKKSKQSDSHWCETPAAAAAVAERFRTSRHVYFGVALQNKQRALAVARHKKPDVQLSSVRGSSASAVAIPGFWVDLDIQAPAHSRQDLPPDENAALGLLKSIPHEPSVIVRTGNGLHVYWVFREPWLLESDDERARAATLVRRLQQTIREAAQEKSWAVDSTADLARVLRLPGTLNHKEAQARPVTILLCESDRRYDAEDFENCLVDESRVGAAPHRATDSVEEPEEPADLEQVVAGCSWLRNCREHQADLSEPEWYACLSVVGRCGGEYENGRALAHDFSKEHAGYSAAETDRKHDQALKASGPRTCKNIAQELGAYEAHCSHCPHWGKIKSPIVLGRPRPVPRAIPYKATDQGLVWLKSTSDGFVPQPLTNFRAIIVEEVVHDDGAESKQTLELEATLPNRKRRFTIPASRLHGMTWVVEELGPQAVVYAGFSTKDHARTAIQLLSSDIGSRTIYGHLGWRIIDDKAYYLHAGGAIGTDGTVSEVETALPSELALFELPDPPEQRLLVDAIRASLRLLQLLPPEVTWPLYCAIWRAVVGPCDFAIHLSGQTGEGKSEVVALIQQHWGCRLDARHLPASWSSTSNALQALAFAAKDAVMVVDDFAPEGSSYDIDRLHKTAADLVRSQGNRSGRQRMRADASLRSTKMPRGLLLSTGEDIPRGHSIRGRMLTLEVPIAGMDWDLLTSCQASARAGIYAAAQAGFVRWLAPRYPELEGQRLSYVAKRRAVAARDSELHQRTPGIVADLAFGAELFLEFAEEVGAISGEEAADLKAQAWESLMSAAAGQAAHLSAENPVQRFLEIIGSALVSGAAHLAATDGKRPPESARFGWRLREPGSFDEGTWERRGEQIGWVDGDDVYLDPSAAYRVAQKAGAEAITMGAQTLWKRLKEQGHLRSIDKVRQRNTVRRTLQGSRRMVLHLSLETLLPQEPSQPSQSSLEEVEGTDCAASGTFSGDGFAPWASKPSHETVPQGAEEPGAGGEAGPVGPVGTVLRTPQAQEHECDLQPDDCVEF